MDTLSNAVTTAINLLSSSGPWLVISFALAGLLREFVPMGWLVNYLGSKGLKSLTVVCVAGAVVPS